MIDRLVVEQCVERALHEDIGFFDATSEIVIPAQAQARFLIVARQAASGLALRRQRGRARTHARLRQRHGRPHCAFERRLFNQSYAVPILWFHRITVQSSRMRGWTITSNAILGLDLTDVRLAD